MISHNMTPSARAYPLSQASQGAMDWSVGARQLRKVGSDLWVLGEAGRVFGQRLFGRRIHRHAAIAGAVSLAAVGAASADTTYMRLPHRHAILARPESPLLAPAGVTALAGEVVTSSGVGLPGVIVSSGSNSTVTGADGKFLVSNALLGKSVLQVDGRHAGYAHQDYGLYQIAVVATPGLTTVLPFKSWLTPIDHSHDVTLPSPTTSPVVITNPALPGVQLKIPAGVVVRDADGGIVKKIGLTPLPPGRSPVPSPADADIPMNFTIQPGASCLYDANGGVGTAQIIMPNLEHSLPKARAGFFRYEPDRDGWNPYGEGSVSADGSQIVPDASTVLTDFSSAECDPATKSRPALPMRIPVLVPVRGQ